MTPNIWYLEHNNDTQSKESRARITHLGNYKKWNYIPPLPPELLSHKRSCWGFAGVPWYGNGRQKLYQTLSISIRCSPLKNQHVTRETRICGDSVCQREKTRSLFSAFPFCSSPFIYSVYTGNDKESSGALQVGKYVFKGTFVFVVNLICRGDY